MYRYLIPLAVLLSLAVDVRADVQTVRVPQGGLIPEVVLDAKGTLHMVYGTGGQPGNAMYVQSTDGGKTFSRPVQINSQASIVTIGMERGPKLAIGKDGTIHVIWLGYYKSGGGVWYNRSADGGKSFEREKELLDSKYGADNATIAADAEGTVIALWTGGFPGAKEDPKSPYGAPLIMSRSADDGQTFSKNELAKYNNPTRICECCRLEAKIVGSDLYVAFRGSWQSLRDPYLMVGDKKQNNFRVVPIAAENWKNVCPMQGIPFSVDKDGRVLASYMVRNKVYWTLSDAGAKKFGPKVTPPDGGKSNGSMPLAVMNQKGDVLFVWKEGQQVSWAIYDRTGKPTKDQGQAGQLAGPHKPTAFVGADDRFVIVY